MSPLRTLIVGCKDHSDMITVSLKNVRTDPALLRPAEVDHLIGDASKAKKVLGWKPSVSFEQLIAMMVDADMTRLSTPAKPAALWIPR